MKIFNSKYYLTDVKNGILNRKNMIIFDKLF